MASGVKSGCKEGKVKRVHFKHLPIVELQNGKLNVFSQIIASHNSPIIDEGKMESANAFVRAVRLRKSNKLTIPHNLHASFKSASLY